jgi:putative transposase
LEDVPFHITQRGNGRQQVFFEESDYRLYLDLLSRYALQAKLEIEAYCLMPNHVHLIAVPRRLNAMASVLSRTHADYARYFNLKLRTCRHVWQSRYFSCPLADSHLRNAIAYVERNPVRAKLAASADQFPWSSARQHLDLQNQASASLLDTAL